MSDDSTDEAASSWEQLQDRLQDITDESTMALESLRRRVEEQAGAFAAIQKQADDLFASMQQQKEETPVIGDGLVDELDEFMDDGAGGSATPDGDAEYLNEVPWIRTLEIVTRVVDGEDVEVWQMVNSHEPALAKTVDGVQPGSETGDTYNIPMLAADENYSGDLEWVTPDWLNKLLIPKIQCFNVKETKRGRILTLAGTVYEEGIFQEQEHENAPIADRAFYMDGGNKPDSDLVAEWRHPAMWDGDPKARGGFPFGESDEFVTGWKNGTGTGVVTVTGKFYLRTCTVKDATWNVGDPEVEDDFTFDGAVDEEQLSENLTPYHNKLQWDNLTDVRSAAKANNQHDFRYCGLGGTWNGGGIGVFNLGIWGQSIGRGSGLAEDGVDSLAIDLSNSRLYQSGSDWTLDWMFGQLDGDDWTCLAGTKFRISDTTQAAGSTITYGLSGACVHAFQAKGDGIFGETGDYQAHLGASDMAGYFKDLTNSVQVCDGTYALDVPVGDINIATGQWYKVAGVDILTDRATGWASPTGTLARADYAVYAGQTVSNPPTQAEVQAIDNHVVILSQTLKALISDLHVAGGKHALLGA